MSTRSPRRAAWISVTITDHDEISGALALRRRSDVVVGCEVTGVFPADGVRVHLNVFGLDAASHAEAQRLRTDVRALMPFLNREVLFTSLNHVASGINGPLTSAHVAALLPWVDALEVRNGSRLPIQNRTAECLAQAARKIVLGGSDCHTERGIGLTWTEVPGATSVESFFDGLRNGRGQVGGVHGSQWTMSSDIVRFAANCLREHASGALRRPGSCHLPLALLGGVLGLPLVATALAGGFLHFVHEERFNRDLLFDLVARPSDVVRRVRELAA